MFFGVSKIPLFLGVRSSLFKNKCLVFTSVSYIQTVLLSIIYKHKILKNYLLLKDFSVFIIKVVIILNEISNNKHLKRKL